VRALDSSPTLLVNLSPCIRTPTPPPWLARPSGPPATWPVWRVRVVVTESFLRRAVTPPTVRAPAIGARLG
jgi:hypothetical protein